MSNEYMSEKDLIKSMERIVDRVLPNIIRQKSNSFNEGVIVNAEPTTRTAQVRLTSTGEVMTLKYSKGITSVVAGDRCLVISVDPNSKSRCYIVGIY